MPLGLPILLFILLEGLPSKSDPMTSTCGNDDAELAVHVEPPSEFCFLCIAAPNRCKIAFHPSIC